jgi:spore coat polysaccharide biosynthesis protein SpsF
MRCVATIEARMTSSRLPGKVLMTAAGKPFLQILIERLQRAKRLDGIVVATTTNRQDDPIAELAKRLGVDVFRGSEEDVLGRVCGALRQARADICVEITADCPLIDPVLVDEAVKEYQRTTGQHSYISNSDPQRSVPAGLDVQVFSSQALFQLADQTQDPQDREHVSYGFYRPESGNRWHPRFIVHESCRGGEKVWVTLDYREDYELIRRIHEDLSVKNSSYSAGDILRWVREHPELHEPCLRVRKQAAHV